MLPTAYVAHRLPGRVRLKIPAMQGDSEYFDTLAKQFESDSDVTGLSARPRSASLVIEHSGDDEAVLAALGSKFFVLATRNEPGGRQSKLSRREKASLRASSVGFAGLTLYQLARGRYTSSAVENLWNAYGAYRTLNKPLLAIGFAAVGVHQIVDGKLFTSALSSLFYAFSAKKMATGQSGGSS